MPSIASLVEHILKSEGPVLVTLALVLAGAALLVGERFQIFDFAGLPTWARPSGEILWVVSACYLVVRVFWAVLIALARAQRYASEFPQRQSQRRADRAIVNRLNGITGVAREVLCYARFREDNHIWTQEPIGGGDATLWSRLLRANGLIELYDSGFGTAHFRIHRVAWDHMRRYPNRYQPLIAWPRAPWEIVDAGENERVAEEENAKRRGGGTPPETIG